jgi:ribosomal protein S4
MPLVEFMARHGLTITFAQARRLIKQGGVSLNGEKVSDIDELCYSGDTAKIGKKRAVVEVLPEHIKAWYEWCEQP